MRRRGEHFFASQQPVLRDLIPAELITEEWIGGQKLLLGVNPSLALPGQPRVTPHTDALHLELVNEQRDDALVKLVVSKRVERVHQ